jgi:uncharacterized protein (TIGR03000 family)
MNHRFTIGGRVVPALAAAFSIVSSALAQSTGSDGTYYPYWSSAPQSYRGSSLTIPVPGISPNLISNAARSTPFDPDRSMYRSSNIGGGFIPPYLTAIDINLSHLRKTQMETDNRAHIWLRVAENADVWVNGAKTRQAGESRYYYSPPLTPGRQYAYEMRIRWMKDGKPVEETQRVLVYAGSRTHRDFTEPLGDKKKASPSGDSAKK